MAALERKTQKREGIFFFLYLSLSSVCEEHKYLPNQIIYV